MRNFTLSALLFSIYISGQNITTEDFRNMVATSYSLIDKIEKSQFDQLIIDFKIHPKERNKLNSQISARAKKDSFYTAPHYYLTKSPNTFKMVITSFKPLEKIGEENFNRGEYNFVIKSIVTIDPEKQIISYSDTKILTYTNEINNWWLSEYKTYMAKTTKVHDKYNYVPPPPPCPPLELN